MQPPIAYVVVTTRPFTRIRGSLQCLSRGLLRASPHGRPSLSIQTQRETATTNREDNKKMEEEEEEEEGTSPSLSICFRLRPRNVCTLF